MKFRVLVVISLFAGVFAGCESERKVATPEMDWVGTWSTAIQLVEPHNMPPEPGLSGNTLRQIVKVSAGGEVLRLRLSNRFGTEPVVISEVRFAQSAGGGRIISDTDTEVFFNGSPSLEIAPGEAIVSDPFDFLLQPLSEMAITIHVESISEDITGHPGSRTTSYIASGNVVSETELADAVPAERWYIIDGLDVKVPESHGAISIIGNS
ncbi:hypothetical protein QLX67_13465, partial [Balneolaceae bacterium ANBcel3]|nr:hypothetical protein [Balneolaceae bacterium ANBcel3]